MSLIACYICKLYIKSKLSIELKIKILFLVF